MDCEYYQKLMSRMLDGDLSADETEDLRAHVQSCSSCHAVFTAFADLSACLKENLAEPPVSLRETIMDGIRPQKMDDVRPRKKKREPIPLILKILVPTAACFALLATGAIYLTYYGSNITAPTADSALQMTAAAPKTASMEDSDMENSLYAAESATSDVTAAESSAEPGSGASQSEGTNAEPTPASGTAGAAAPGEGKAATGSSSASSIPSKADVYGESGKFVGMIEADNVKTFLNTVCTNGGSTYTTDKGTNYTVDCGGTTYEFITQDSKLWWRISGAQAFTRSPSSVNDFLALMNK